MRALQSTEHLTLDMFSQLKYEKKQKTLKITDPAVQATQIVKFFVLKCGLLRPTVYKTGLKVVMESWWVTNDVVPLKCVKWSHNFKAMKFQALFNLANFAVI